MSYKVHCTETKIMQVDNLTKYGAEFQIKCVSALLSDKSFVERVYEILDPKIFESDANQWIVEQIKDYFVQYKDLPTPTVFKYKVDELMKGVGDDKKATLLKAGIVTQLRSILLKTTESDIKFIKDEFLTFCINRSMRNAVLESADLVKSGEYTKIRTVIENALKAGMERDLGHDYVNDVEERLNDAVRSCIKTNIPVVDELLDGGLGKGELGFVIGSAGSGKCVGPNTEIEIQYEEIGIPIKTDLSENEMILWIDPFLVYDLGGSVGSVYGWQIEKICNNLGLVGTGKNTQK